MYQVLFVCFPPFDTPPYGLSDVAVDWSDHALWWPQKNSWLTRTKSTLDQYGVQADALLHFTPMHKTLRIQLPDLRFIDTKVDVSVKCFNAVISLSKDLNIRHPEEVSFCRPLTNDHLKRNFGSRTLGATSRQRAKDFMGPIFARSEVHSNETMVNGNNYGSNLHPSGPGVYGTTGGIFSNSNGDGKTTPGLIDERTSTPLWSSPVNQTNGTSPRTMFNGSSPGNNQSGGRSGSSLHNHPTQHDISTGTMMSGNSTIYGGMMYSNVTGENLSIPNLMMSPSVPTLEAKTSLIRPKSLVEKARLNAGWLDSSLSLYEQDVREYDLLLLRFKFYSFYDLSPKTDGARINEIYEQAKWSILTEEMDCTEREMMMFAALQLQIQIQSNNPGSDDFFIKNHSSHTDNDIDSALNDLQNQLEGTGLNGHHHSSSHSSGHHSSGNNQANIGSDGYQPELSDYLRFSKPRRFTLKATKKLYFVLRDTKLSAFKTREDRFGEPSFIISLRGTEVTPDVNLSQQRYAIKLEVPSQDGMTEYNIRFNSEEQYGKWLAAFRLGSKGRSMSDPSYDSEVRQILDFLSIQHPSMASPVMTASQIDINPDDYVAPRFLRKINRRNQVVNRILEAHANVKDLSFTESKLHYIKAWQALPDYGISLFVVRFSNSKKEVSLCLFPDAVWKSS